MNKNVLSSQNISNIYLQQKKKKMTIESPEIFESF